MEFKDKDRWEKGLAKNTDPYGRACFDYAEAWANLMEENMQAGKTIAECAKETSHEADTDGITGYMYGCAVNILSGVWTHDEELRTWHNLDTQIGNEGEKANETGSTLNPALLNVG